MKAIFVAGAALLLTAQLSAQQSWTGRISDSMCKAKHEEAAEGEGKMPDRDCTLSCVRGGSTFVLVSDQAGRVLQIASQDLKELTALAGRKVKLTGELKGDAITVATIEALSEKP